ncbi:MAG: AAA family ATPase [Planctomycetaceae bacterium]|jgi:predicted ATPase|nr:AAA family ATPase [Planctomycetaceae bacterium]
MKLESIHIKNFRAFRDASMEDIPNFCVIVGANGSGKSTLFQLFGFLRDAMKDNVSVALAKLGGGRGFREVRSRNSEGPIEIELKFRESPRKPLITYELAINEDNKGTYVEREILKYRRGSKGQPWQFLNFSRGTGFAVVNEYDEVKSVEELKRDEQSLKAPNILAIKGLSQFEKYPAVRMLGDLVENWHISDFHISEARNENTAGYAEHLAPIGNNLPLVTQFLYQNYREVFDDILSSFPNRVPGITAVEAKETEEGKVLLRFQDSSFKEPFLSPFVSDGTIKMFAYLVLLNDPKPHQLLCVEEPENQLYPKLLAELAEEFRAYAKKGTQVFVSTHSPDFLDAAELDEVFLLVKEKGYTTISRANDIEPVKNAMMNHRSKMGLLWQEGYFSNVDP